MHLQPIIHYEIPNNNNNNNKLLLLLIINIIIIVTTVIITNLKNNVNVNGALGSVSKANESIYEIVIQSERS